MIKDSVLTPLKVNKKSATKGQEPRLLTCMASSLIHWTTIVYCFRTGILGCQVNPDVVQCILNVLLPKVRNLCNVHNKFGNSWQMTKIYMYLNIQHHCNATLAQWSFSWAFLPFHFDGGITWNCLLYQNIFSLWYKYTSDVFRLFAAFRSKKVPSGKIQGCMKMGTATRRRDTCSSETTTKNVFDSLLQRGLLKKRISFLGSKLKKAPFWTELSVQEIK